MKILIKSREKIEKMSELPFVPKTALISISDVGDETARLINSPDYILNLSFNDVDNDVLLDEVGHRATAEGCLAIEKKYAMLSEEQAAEIADFYFSVCDSTEHFICQCEHGQSRSAAVAAAILEYRNRSGIKVFSDDKYYPNKVVFCRVLSALRAKGR